MKLTEPGIGIPTPTIREQDPLKQGLKPVTTFLCSSLFGIREQDPLKQGLKQRVAAHGKNTCEIREQDPLKQGLKLRRR